jgi:superfamily II DNA or RNA helicase
MQSSNALPSLSSGKNKTSSKKHAQKEKSIKEYDIHGIPFRKEPRKGQLQAFLEFPHLDRMFIKFPGGYGKTFTAAGCFSVKQRQGADCFLFIATSPGIKDQFIETCNNGTLLKDAGIIGPNYAIDLSTAKTHDAINAVTRDGVKVFALNIHSLLTKAKHDLIRQIMSYNKNKWVVCIDEYHRYGAEKAWSAAVKNLDIDIVLGMSATPPVDYRKTDDGAFNEKVNIEVTYRDAVDEKAVKPLYGHKYNYIVDIIGEDKNIYSKTLCQIAEEINSDSPDDIDKYMIDNKLRWSSEYTTPLVSAPLARLLEMRQKYPHVKTQAIFFCMSVSHAKSTCKIIQKMYGNFFTVDWVGTGINGRNDDENKKIVKDFCDAKFDILVNVGVAGEGIDTVNVTEIVFLKKVNTNIMTIQAIYRGSRIIPALRDEKIHCIVNFDQDTKVPAGSSIMDWVDNKEPKEESEDDIPDILGDDYDPAPVSEDLEFDTRLITFDHVDHGDFDLDEDPTVNPDLVEYAQHLKNLVNNTATDIGKGLRWGNYDGWKEDPSAPEWLFLMQFVSKMRMAEKLQYDKEARLEYGKNALLGIIGKLTKEVNDRLHSSDRLPTQRNENMNKIINTKKAWAIGKLDSDSFESYQKHHKWVAILYNQIVSYKKKSDERAKGIPLWLNV